MLCTRNRWGTGSCSSYTPKTQESKEMEDKLKKMMADRAKQDTMWLEQPQKISNSANKEPK